MVVAIWLGYVRGLPLRRGIKSIWDLVVWFRWGRKSFSENGELSWVGISFETET